MKQLILWLGVLGGSTAAVFIRWSTAPSLVLVAYRMFFAVLLLLPAAVRHRGEFSEIPQKTLLLCVCSGVALGLHFAAYFEAVKTTSIVASSVLVDMEVLFVALAGVLIFHKPIPIGGWLSIFLALGGAVTIALADAAGGGGTNALLGDALALLASALMGVYTMLGGACRKRVSTTVYTYLVYFVAMLTVLVLTAVDGAPLFGYGAVNFATAFGMAVCCTLLGHSIFSWCLKYLSPSVVSTTRLMDCVFGAVWSLLIFGERPGFPVFLGGGMIILGVILYGRIAARED